MPWSTRPRNDKYGHGHAKVRAAMKAQLERDGSAYCAQPICVMPSRLILPGMKWCAGHDDPGTEYIGLVHKRCNESDAGRRARARQSVTRLQW